ncbi:hypothetical protein TNCV_2487201 [Trichonephila clavipes]|uniref:Uncharacterized protein n=1 Tax=Trichonephila clavipes TaxID=2585209 RepID=A0A8X6W032_TRICX|nr:hypothetical protein TNCV_2487201 [Trichonephila clavipes]
MIEAPETWRQSSRSATSNAPLWLAKRWLRTVCVIEKLCWCTIMHERHFLVLSGETPEKAAFFNLSMELQIHASSGHSFSCPSECYIYRDFHRINIVWDPMFCIDLSSPCCLLPPHCRLKLHSVYTIFAACLLVHSVSKTVRSISIG